ELPGAMFGMVHMVAASPDPDSRPIPCHRVSCVPKFRDPQDNMLLAALSTATYERLSPLLQYVELPLGKVMYESGDAQLHVYFPTDSIISLLYVMEDGGSAEISIVCNDGMLGI